MSDEFPNDPVTRRTEARIAIVEGRPNDAIGILRERGDLSPLGEGADIEEADREDSFDESDLQSSLVEADDK